MALLTYVQIVGRFTYRDANETPARGQEMHFIPITGTVPKGGTVTLAKTFSCRLDSNGEIPANFQLPTFSDTSVLYKVKEQFSGGRDPYIIEVKATDTLIDLATFVPVAPPPEMQSALSAAVIAAAQGFADSADASADEAAGSASAAAISAASADATILRGDIASTASGKGAELVGFLQSGAGAVPRTMLDKARDAISVKDFGAVGDGIADDTAALQTAIDAEVPINFGSSTFRITAPIARAMTGVVHWESDGARIMCDFSTPVQRAITLTEVSGLGNYIGPMYINGSDKAFVGLRVIAATDAGAEIYIDRPIVENIKRSSVAFSEGNGIYVTGDFTRVSIDRPFIRNVTMSAGTGVPGAQGVTGISVRAGNGRAALIDINAPYVENISSDDLNYVADQDGILIFTDRSTSDIIRPTTANIRGAFIKNCLGRSVKIQCENASVSDIKIQRTTGFTSVSILPDIDLQVGGGRVSGISAHYDGVSYKPASLVLVNTSDATEKLCPIGQVDGVQVTLTNGAALQTVMMASSRGKLKSAYRLRNVSVEGSGLTYVARLIGAYGGDYHLSLEGVDASPSTSFVWAFASGAGATGTVTGRNCVNFGSVIPFMTNNLGIFKPRVSLQDCIGFSAMKRVYDATGTDPVGDYQRVDFLVPKYADRSGGARFIGKLVANGEVWKLPSSFSSANTGTLIVSAGSKLSQGIFSCDSAGVSALTPEATDFTVGGTTEPASGSYRLWSDGTGPYISNRSGADRSITIIMFG